MGYGDPKSPKKSIINEMTRVQGTLGFLPKIPFKLTQSIHVALQKTAILTKKMSKYSVFNTETNKGNIGLYFENNEKNC